LKDDQERAAYDLVWDKYRFAGEILKLYAPYTRLLKSITDNVPALPLDVSELEHEGVKIPGDIKTATAYREFFALLSDYARNGLRELRAVNPITRDKAQEEVKRDG